VNESGLTDLSTYYAVSQTYAEQAPEAAQQIKDLGLNKVGVVIEDTPSFQDAHTAFIKAAKDAGLDVVTDDSIGKTASEAEALAEVQKLKDAGADVVYLLASPLVYLSLAGGARNQNFEPTFFGPGITNGINQVAEFGCPGVSNGQFLSPYPELDIINSLDPDYLTAYEQFGGGKEADDIGIALWGLNKNIKLMFEAAGDKLGRAALMNAIEKGEDFTSSVYPPVKFTAKDHFGGTDAYLLKADCEAKDYKTEKQSVATSKGD
jgi:branched-chain amino acid transport system substrate-binding protein